MLVAAPSSSCDVCYHPFGPDRPCHCIPCGHIFCLQCLTSLPRNRYSCPLCRRHLQSSTRIRKVIVDWSASGELGGHNNGGGDSTRENHRAENGNGDGEDVSEREARDLEKRIARSQREGAITITQAMELQQMVDEFMSHRQENEYPVLVTLMATVYRLCEVMGALDDVRNQRTELEGQNRNLQQRHDNLEFHMLRMHAENQHNINSRRATEAPNQSLMNEVKKLKEENSQLRESAAAQLPSVGTRPSTLPPKGASLPTRSSSSHNVSWDRTNNRGRNNAQNAQNAAQRSPPRLPEHPRTSQYTYFTPPHGRYQKGPHGQMQFPPSQPGSLPQSHYPTPPHTHVPPQPYRLTPPHLSHQPHVGLGLNVTPPYTPGGATLPVSTHHRL